ncbi:MAG TPA: peroxiredoxin [Anaeromyxobacteraceae bacterium]|nr:peroxiredoxin [Anaeromyxobacteraceae bacterium]
MPKVLDEAPRFKATAVVGKGEFQSLDLADYAGSWVVLVFYPADFTTVCPTELLELSRRTKEFAALNAEVVGVSTDSKHSHRAWISMDLGELSFPLVADPKKEITRAYGALLEQEGVAARATFLVDPVGIIQYVSFHPPSVGRSVSEILRVLEGLQTGDNVPVEWSRGKPTLGKP